MCCSWLLQNSMLRGVLRQLLDCRKPCVELLQCCSCVINAQLCFRRSWRQSRPHSWSGLARTPAGRTTPCSSQSSPRSRCHLTLCTLAGIRAFQAGFGPHLCACTGCSWEAPRGCAAPVLLFTCRCEAAIGTGCTALTGCLADTPPGAPAGAPAGWRQQEAGQEAEADSGGSGGSSGDGSSHARGGTDRHCCSHAGSGCCWRQGRGGRSRLSSGATANDACQRCSRQCSGSKGRAHGCRCTGQQQRCSGGRGVSDCSVCQYQVFRQRCSSGGTGGHTCGQAAEEAG